MGIGTVLGSIVALLQLGYAYLLLDQPGKRPARKGYLADFFIATTALSVIVLAPANAIAPGLLCIATGARYYKLMRYGVAQPLLKGRSVLRIRPAAILCTTNLTLFWFVLEAANRGRVLSGTWITILHVGSYLLFAASLAVLIGLYAYESIISKPRSTEE